MHIHSLDLFSGIGGMSLAFKDTFKTIAYCESAPRCWSILQGAMVRGNIDTAPIHDNVCTLKASHVLSGINASKTCHVITAGFPCQDISAASQTRLGVHGEHSSLVRHVFRLCDEMPSVQVLILENSDMILHRGYEEIATQLKMRGFELHWEMFSASELVGALHRRRRWIGLAVRKPQSKITQQILSAIKSIPRGLAMSWWNKWHSWKNVAPPTLVPLSSSRTENTVTRWRCKLLGNGIVPCMVAEASRRLAIVITGIDNETATQSYNVPPNKVDLHLRDWKRGPPTTKEYFATPAFSHWSWHFYTQLTPRSTRVFQNQLLYMMPLKSEKHAEEIRKTMIVNPNFVEFVMGIPKDYTNTNR